MTRTTGTLHEYLRTFIVISRAFLLRMRNVSDKIYSWNKKTHFMSSNFFFFRKLCRLWDNEEKYGRGREDTSDNTNAAHAG